MSIQPVLIVGAGPTGLSAAAFLSKLGVKVRVIDKNAARSQQSKALGIQAGTLECFDAAFGPEISKALTEAGRPTQEGWLHFGDEHPFHIRLDAIPSRYNSILITAQSETERVLEEYLNRHGVFVERQIEFLSLKNRATSVTTQIRKSTGEIERFEASWVLGCDGAHSQVRTSLEIPFEGGTYVGHFILGDVELDASWSHEGVQLFASNAGLIAAFPLKGKRRYRLIMISHRMQPEGTGAEISLDDFVSTVNELSQNQIRVVSCEWSTRFRVHHRLAQEFQKERAFLVGDAAHIHSPAGGQGMNIGIQDAFNLAAKLKSVIEGKALESSLLNYQKERYPIARNVVRFTDLAFRLLRKLDQPVPRFLRRKLFFPVVSIPWVQKQLVTGVSEVHTARKEIQRAASIYGVRLPVV